MNSIIIVFAIFILNNLNYIYGQTYFQGFHFKPDRNSDFGLLLPETQEKLLDVSNYELSDLVPKYCCGATSFYDSNYNLIVNSETTFSQYWSGSVSDTGYCNNYGVLLGPFDYTYIGDYFSKYELLGSIIKSSLTNKGFNNYTEFPNYIDDPYTDLFCWHAQFTVIRNIIDGSNYANVLAPGEVFAFLNGEKVYEYSGVSGDYSNPIIINSDGTFDLFGCSRSNYIGDIVIEFEEISAECNSGGCDTCGPSANCESNCIDIDKTNCMEIKYQCGSCTRVPRDCEDDDPCTINECRENEGCTSEPIDGCENCIEGENCGGDLDTDKCNPHHCVNNLCIANPVICVGNSSCIEPFCLDGICICSSITTSTTTITSTSETTTSPITTTSETLTSTTSQTTTSPITTIATISTDTTTTASSLTTSITSSSISPSISTLSTTLNPNHQTKCDINSCPPHYCCIQLDHSYSCVSKYFEDQCNIYILKDIY